MHLGEVSELFRGKIKLFEFYTRQISWKSGISNFQQPTFHIRINFPLSEVRQTFDYSTISGTFLRFPIRSFDWLYFKFIKFSTTCPCQTSDLTVISSWIINYATYVDSFCRSFLLSSILFENFSFLVINITIRLLVSFVLDSSRWSFEDSKLQETRIIRRVLLWTS